MRIEWVEAHAFGPLVDRRLPLRPGLNVVWGRNEAGKSSWHAALYAALCGMRRGPGITSDAREFAERHRPWSAEEWRTSLYLTLADGREIEIQQDLDGRVDCRAIEHPTGRVVSDEIMFEGAPDGATWLGLSRRTFLHVACVRQTEVRQVREHAGALQALLQQAAANATAGATAAEAIRRIEAFRAERVGSLRAPTRPLRVAMARLEDAETALHRAQQEHDTYLTLQQDVEKYEHAAERTEHSLRLVEAARALQEARVLEGRLAKATELSAAFPEGEPEDPAADPALAEQVVGALQAWEQRPPAQALDGESSGQLEARLRALPPVPDGDLAVHESVTDALAAHRLAAGILAEHRRERPLEPVEPATGGLEASELRDHARDLVAEPLPPVQAPARPLVPLVAGAVAIGLGVALAVLGEWATAAVVALLGAGGIAWSVIAGRRPASVALPAPSRAEAARSRLVGLGIPVDPAELRRLADEAEEADRLRRTLLRWQGREVELVAEADRAVGALRAALVARGHQVDGEEPLDEALGRYQEQCRLRHERGQLIEQLERRREAEERDARRRRAESTIREVVGSVGIADVDHVDPEQVAGALRAWRTEHQHRVQELKEQREQWTALQVALDGRTLDELRERASRARDAAQQTAPGLDPEELERLQLADDVEARIRELREQRDQAREVLTTARAHLSDHAQHMPDVAEAAEELVRAREELDRLQDLDRILERTTAFLEEAEDRAHRNIAPILQETLRRWLPSVTDGRYVDALVDPETLLVQVRSDGGNWRPAHRLSHGTAEQVYLLLRVALAEHLGRPEEPCPLILDDVTVQSDDERTCAILEVLASLATERQVILFSQEAEVLQWAREREETLHVVELPVLAPAR